METQLVEEGSAHIYVSRLDRYMTSEREYVPSRTPVFYNPLMKTNRDLAVAFLRTVGEIQGGKLTIGDPLAGVGVRSLRALKETRFVSDAFANDLNERAVDIMRRNAKLNEVEERLSVSSMDANIFLAEHSKPGSRFGYVDIDPFGSPSPYLDNAVMSLVHRGFLAVTATDMPVLCGTYPKKMRIAYDSYCPKLPFLKEVGARVLMGAVARAAARHRIGVNPFICYGERNYLRAYFQVFRSRSKALLAMERVGYLAVRRDPMEWHAVSYRDLAESGFSSDPFGALYGPMWIGEYEDAALVARLGSVGMGVSPQSDVLIRKISEEDGGILGYYTHDVLARACGGEALPIGDILDRLRERGIRASRTLFDPSAVKADLNFKELSDALSS